MTHIIRSFARVSVLAALLVVCLPLTALANGPLAVCTPGQPFLWPAGGANIPYNPDQGDLGPLNNAAAVALVGTAFGAWDAIPTASTTYANAGPLPVDVDITNFLPYLEPAAPDGFSAVVFDDTGEIFDLLFGPGSGILGFAGPEWVNTLSCDILEGVAFLNGPSFGDATEALDVLVHEFGHYQNLAHTVVNGQILLGDTSGPTPNNTFPIPPLAGKIETMYPFYFGALAGTSSPHLDDIAGLSTLYPGPGFAAATATIAGTVLAPNGTTRLTGVNVIARNIVNPFDDAVSAISSDFTDETSQASPLVGRYTIRGLTPGASYAVYVDGILAGGFSTPPMVPLPGPEEFYNGAAESTDSSTDVPSAFTPVSAAAGGTAGGIDILFNAFVAGDPLPVGDDGSVQLFLPFTFDLCGQAFDSVFLNANGSLTFGAASGDFSETRVEFLSGPPRAAGLWDDLNPAAGGVVTFGQTAHTFTASWTGVPEYPNAGANTFSIKLYKLFDRVDATYGAMSAIDGLAGVSCGGKVTSRFENQQDLSRYRNWFVELLSDAAGYEVFNPSRPFDLANSTLRYTGTLNYSDRWAGSNDTIATAKKISLPFNSASVLRFTELEAPGDVDFYRFKLKAGQILAVETLTGQLDTMIGLFDTAGNLLALDDDGGSGVLSRLLVQAAVDLDLVLGVTTYPDFGFTGSPDTGRYVLNVQTHTGTLLPAGDDTSTPVSLGFDFPFQGQVYDSVFVNSNGNLTFGLGSTDFSETVAELLSGQPRIAALWDDLNANGGLVIATPETGAMTIHFVSVPEFATDLANYFSIRLESNGRVTLSYGGVLAQDGIAGITEGGGAVDPGPVDLSRLFSVFPKTGTTYQQFSLTLPEVFDLSFRPVFFR